MICRCNDSLAFGMAQHSPFSVRECLCLTASLFRNIVYLFTVSHSVCICSVYRLSIYIQTHRLSKHFDLVLMLYNEITKMKNFAMVSHLFMVVHMCVCVCVTVFECGFFALFPYPLFIISFFPMKHLKADIL